MIRRRINSFKSLKIFILLAIALVFLGTVNLLLSQSGYSSLISDLSSQNEYHTPAVHGKNRKVVLPREEDQPPVGRKDLISKDETVKKYTSSVHNIKSEQHIRLSTINQADKLNDSHVVKNTVLKNRQVNQITQSTHIQSPKLAKVQLKDLFISIKTGKNNHNSRIDLLLQTWISDAMNETYIISDGFDQRLHDLFGDRFINTSCGEGRSRESLYCKMSAEFDHFLLTDKKWFCHVDDDVYVNIPRLVATLTRYDVRKPWYLGKISVMEPMSIRDPNNPKRWLRFQFGTGGAGICLSRELAHRMKAFAGGGRLTQVGNQIRLPDDCVIGYIVELLVGVRMTELPNLHSHLESLGSLDPTAVRDAITLSYSVGGEGRDNYVNLPRSFSPKDDPTRLKTVHCFLFPSARLCSQLRYN